MLKNEKIFEITMGQDTWWALMEEIIIEKLYKSWNNSNKKQVIEIIEIITGVRTVVLKNIEKK